MHLALFRIIVGLFVFTGCSLWAPFTAQADLPQESLAFQRAVLLSRGVNFGEWLWTPTPYNTNYHNIQPGAKDFNILKKLGITHVRLPITPSFLFLDRDYSKPDKEHFAFLKQFITTAGQYKLAVILDLHPENAEYQRALPKAAHIWSVMATHFVSEPENIFYETFNEPKFSDAREWRVFQTEIIKSIRKIDSKHTIIVDGLYQAYYTGLNQLSPLEDRNVIYSFHYYNPLTFTHQGAKWVPPFNHFYNIHYPTNASHIRSIGSLIPDYKQSLALVREMELNYNKTLIQQELAVPAAFSKKYNVPVYCGEFGVHNVKTPYPDRIQWYLDVIEGLKANNMGFAMWNYIGQDFALDLPIFAGL